jgi:hypothetical protein
MDKESTSPLSVLPHSPPVPEEPLEINPKSKLACAICGKTFRTHSELDRHMEHMHGNPEKTHLSPHSEKV